MGGDEFSREDSLVTVAPARSHPAESTKASGGFKQKRWFARYPWSFLLVVVSAMATVGVVVAVVAVGPSLRSSLPEIEDFRPSLAWSCPNTVNSPRPVSCDTPLRIQVDCFRSDHPIHLAGYGRPFTALEARNLDAACDLLPVWLDSDARLVVVANNEAADVDIQFQFAPENKRFGAFRMLATDNKTQQTHEVVASTMAEGGTTAGGFMYSAISGLRARGLLR